MGEKDDQARAAGSSADDQAQQAAGEAGTDDAGTTGAMYDGGAEGAGGQPGAMYDGGAEGAGGQPGAMYDGGAEGAGDRDADPDRAGERRAPPGNG